MKLALWPRRKKAKNSERKARFLRLIQLAHETAAIDSVGLRSLVRLTAANLQSRKIASVAYSAPHTVRRSDNLDSLFFDQNLPLTPERHSAFDLVLRSSEQKYLMRLNEDPILTNPWNRERISSALATIGFGKRQGAWKEESNHRVTMILPFGVGLVTGGNHSIAAGIVDGQGCITTVAVEDMTPLYKYVHYDGESFLRTSDGLVLSQPQDEEPGILYEIGRLMIRYGVGPSATCLDSQVEYKTPSSDTDFYYKVFFDGQDSGRGLTSSGAALALRKAGLREGSLEWDRVLDGKESLKQVGFNGKLQTVELRGCFRRQVFNDISFIHGVNVLSDRD